MCCWELGVQVLSVTRQWARTNQHSNRTVINNPGWPGCCRAPQVQEYVTIPPADWPAVSIIYKVPIPKDIKQVLDLALSKPNPYLRNGTQERKALNRANSSPSSTLSRSSGAAHAAAMAIPHRNKGGGSPQSKPSSLGGSAEHGFSGSLRRSGDTPMKRIEGFRTTPPSSVRKLTTDGEHGHPPVSKTSLIAASIATSPTHKAEDKPALKRRASVSSTRSSRSSNSGPQVTPTRVTAGPKTPTATKNAAESKSEKSSSPTLGIEKDFKSLKVKTDSLETSSDGGSRSGSADTSTITSDGAFTDYLSDESDAELQRQAEMRAVILEQQRVEDAEFRAARQQLATVDLHPPRAWSAGIPAGRKAVVGGR